MSHRTWIALCAAGLLGCASHPTVRPDDALHDGPMPNEDVRPAEAAALRATDAPPPVPSARSSRGVIARAELIAVLDAAPGRFLQHVETEPRFVHGRFHGWRLASFFPGDERFAGVDLQAGDVVLGVNGRTIEQPDQLMQVWDSLRTGRELVVLLERDGQPRELHYEIR